MAKRFTDSEKWTHPWFQELPIKAKLIWLYILDNCDHAGVWIYNIKMASFVIGIKISNEEMDEFFSEKLKWIDDKRVFVRGFINFQYGDTLNNSNKLHNSVLNILSKYNIDLNEIYKPLASPLLGVKDKDKDKDKEKDKENKNKTIDFEALYKTYPRKEGKQRGLSICKTQIKNQQDYDAVILAIKNYVEKLRRENTEAKYIKQFSTFMTSWRDWLDPETGTSTQFNKNKIDDLFRKENA